MSEHQRAASAASSMLESLEQRILLSAEISGAPSPWIGPEILTIPPSAVTECRSYARSDFFTGIDRISAAKAANPNLDLSSFSAPGLPVSPEGFIDVTVEFSSDRQDMRETLSSMGLDIRSYWQTWFPASRGIAAGLAHYTVLRDIAAAEGVLAVEATEQGHTRSYTSEGDAVLKADELRFETGVDGSGVKIGVISDGVSDWSDVSYAGELPGNLTVNSVPASSGNEGTAMLEIIHDLAPGADLYFSTANGGTTQMASSVNWLIQQGCDVIVDDVGFYNEPMFVDGAVANTVSNAISSGVTYVSAAGNDAQRHYQADFDDDGYGFHLFDQGQNVLRAVVPPSDEASEFGVFLQWSDPWGTSSNNYDLHVLTWIDDEWVLEEGHSSTTVQDGSDHPYEVVPVSAPASESAQLYGIVVAQTSGDGRELEMYLEGRAGVYTGDASLVVPGDSIFGHPAVDAVIATGAITHEYQGDHDEVADYSSHGPSTIYANWATQTSVTRDSLDVCGIAGVQTYVGCNGPQLQPPEDPLWSKGYPSFTGTSAAAPHIAAIAGLLLEIAPSLTPAQVASYINDNAVDLDYGMGYDDVSGYGRADARAIVTDAIEQAPDLYADSDTGVSSTDNLTKLDNSSGDATLDFVVSGSINGATVTLYKDSQAIGSGTGNGGQITITTNGTHDLTDGSHNIRVAQVETGKLYSVQSPALAVTVDTVQPQMSGTNPVLNDGADRRNTLDEVEFTFTENIALPAAGPQNAMSIAVEDLDGGTTTWVTDNGWRAYTTAAADGATATWTREEGESLPNGNLRFTLGSALVTDLAGNGLSGNQVDKSFWRGDYDLDDDVDADDIDGWFAEIIAGTDLDYDLNGDGYLDADDKGILIEELVEVNGSGDRWGRGTAFGDVGLDGKVDGADLNVLAAHWQSSVSSWAEADFTGDGLVDNADLSLLAGNWLYDKWGGERDGGGGESLDHDGDGIVDYDDVLATLEELGLS